MNNINLGQAERVLQLINISGSCQNNDERRLADAELTQLSSSDYFISSLAHTILNNQIEENRLRTAIHLRLFIDRTNLILSSRIDTELSNLKEILLDSALNESYPRVFKQLALLISRIARRYYPRKWPSLFFTILSVLSNESLIKGRSQSALLILHSILKELHSKRIISDRKSFESISSSLLGVLVRYHASSLSYLLELKSLCEEKGDFNSVLSIHFNSLVEIFKVFRLILKPMFYVISFGIVDIDSSNDTNLFFKSSLSILPFCISILLSSNDPNLSKLVSKCILKTIKTLYFSQIEHPLQFYPYLASSLSFFYNLFVQFGSKYHDNIGSQLNLEDHYYVFDSMLIYSANFFSNIIRCPSYRESSGIIFSSTKGVEFRSDYRNIIRQIISEFFDNLHLQTIVNIIISQLLPFTLTELHLWKDVPVDFYLSSIRINKDVDLRASTENLIHSLMGSYGNVIAPLQISMLSYCINIVPISTYPNFNTPEFSQFLVKDAAYNVYGICSFDIHPYLSQNNSPFSFLFINILEKELVNCSNITSSQIEFISSNTIMKYRIARLICQFSDQLQNCIPQVYNSLLLLLSDNDIVVQLATVHTINVLVADLDFSPELFHTILDPLLNRLFEIFDHLYDLESRSNIMALLILLIEQMKVFIIPRIPFIVEKMHKIWNLILRTNQNLLVNYIIRSFSAFFMIMNVKSTELHPMIIPVIINCFNDSVFEFLSEEILELWLKMVQNSPKMDSTLFSLFDFWFRFQDNISYLCILFQLLSSYILLGKGDFIRFYGQRFCAFLSSSMEQLNDEGLIEWSNTLVLLFDYFSFEAISIMPNLVFQLIKAFSADFFSHHHVQCNIMYIFCRLIYHCFDGLVSVLSKDTNSNYFDILDNIIYLIIKRVDYFNYLFRRKLLSFALIRCLDLNNRSFLQQRINDILGIVSGVIAEYEEGPDDANTINEYNLPPFDSCDESSRRFHYISSDPLTHDNLLFCVSSKLSSLDPSILLNIDPVILQQINRFISKY